MSSLEFSNCLGLACSKASSYKALGVSTQAAFDVGVKAKKGALVATDSID